MLRAIPVLLLSLWMPLCEAADERALKLPVQAVELRFQLGHFVLITAGPGRTGAQIVVLDASGREVFRAEPKPLEAGGYRSLTVRDATLAPDGRVLLSVSMGRALGESRNGVMELPVRGGEPRFRDLDGLICHKLLAEGQGAWCLGVDLGRLVRKLPMDVLFRLGPEFDPVPMLPLEKLGVRRREEGGYTGPWSASDLGPPQLFAGAPGAAWAWMPNVDALARADLQAGRVETWPVPLPRAGRSFVSLAATVSGRVFGLFPLRGKEETTEALDTRYGFFEREPDTGRWRLVPRLGDCPRGAQIVGADGESLVVWMRSERRVEWRRP